MLNRATLANWMIYCATQYFRPFYDYLYRELLKREFLMADETRIQVLHEEDRKAETDSFMWLFRLGEDGLPDIVLYKYTKTRARFNAVEFLKGFQGYLETDCYQGYNNLPGIKRCCCFAHLRRYFIEAIPKGEKYGEDLFLFQRIYIKGDWYRNLDRCSSLSAVYYRPTGISIH